jgi:hypothetical protein
MRPGWLHDLMVTVRTRRRGGFGKFLAGFVPRSLASSETEGFKRNPASGYQRQTSSEASLAVPGVRAGQRHGTDARRRWQPRRSCRRPNVSVASNSQCVMRACIYHENIAVCISETSQRESASPGRLLGRFPACMRIVGTCEFLQLSYGRLGSRPRNGPAPPIDG